MKTRPDIAITNHLYLPSRWGGEKEKGGEGLLENLKNEKGGGGKKSPHKGGLQEEERRI